MVARPGTVGKAARGRGASFFGLNRLPSGGLRARGPNGPLDVQRYAPCTPPLRAWGELVRPRLGGQFLHSQKNGPRARLLVRASPAARGANVHDVHVRADALPLPLRRVGRTLELVNWRLARVQRFRDFAQGY